jgi:hypothetical protein
MCPASLPDLALPAMDRAAKAYVPIAEVERTPACWAGVQRTALMFLSDLLAASCRSALSLEADQPTHAESVDYLAIGGAPRTRLKVVQYGPAVCQLGEPPS